MSQEQERDLLAQCRGLPPVRRRQAYGYVAGLSAAGESDEAAAHEAAQFGADLEAGFARADEDEKRRRQAGGGKSA